MSSNPVPLKNSTVVDDIADYIYYLFGIQNPADGGKVSTIDVRYPASIRTELLIWEEHIKKLLEELDALLRPLDMEELDQLLKSFEEVCQDIDTDKEEPKKEKDEQSSDEENFQLYLENYCLIPQGIITLEEIIENDYYFCM